MDRKIFGRRKPANAVGSKIVFAVLLLAIMAFEIFALKLERQSHGPLPPLFGNFPRIQAVLEKQGPKDEFSFAVFGDTEGSIPYALLAEKLRAQPVDFAVHLGDAFDARSYRHFRYLIQEKLAVPFPVFFIQGNQDVKAFPVSRFEEEFGPSLFSFEYQGCLMIGLRMQGESAGTLESIKYLEDVLADAPKEYRKIFVFMHVPPQVLAGHKFAAPEKIMEIFDRYKVDYVFSGHYHGNVHVNKGATNYIVSGSAGKHLEEHPYGEFHHGVVMTVGRDFIAKKIVPLPVGYDAFRRIERYALVEFQPWMMDNRGLVALLNLVVLVLFLTTVKSIVRRKR